MDNFIEENENNYLLTSQRRDIDGPMIDRAMELVKKFIISKNLILFGGMSIDYSLRIKGDKIYPDDNCPDFDVLSKNNIKDAYDLADVLHKIGFENVNVVRGIHFQTMKVKIDSIFVADIGFIPSNIYDLIPTLNYMGFRITHPDFLRMDMHIVFAYPYKDFTMENIFNRWKKDIKRLNLLEKYYPLISTETLNLVASEHKLPFKVVDTKDNLNIAFNGFAAFSIFNIYLNLIAKEFNEPVSIFLPNMSIEITDYFINFNSPTNELHLTTCEIEYINKLSNKKRYRPFLEVLPESYSSNRIHIMYTKYELISVSYVSIVDNKISINDSLSKILVVNPHNLLLWFLVKNLREKNNFYKQFYNYTMDILKYAEDLYFRKSNIDGFMKSPFAPSLDVIGKYNFRPHYIINMARTIKKVKDEAKSFIPNITDILNNMSGNNYNPSTMESHPEISYDHFLFKLDGLEIV